MRESNYWLRIINEIHEEDAKLLLSNGCKLISEGANMPSTPGAIEIYLQEKILYAISESPSMK